MYRKKDARLIWVNKSQGQGSHTFVVIAHEMISRVILLPSADSRRVVVSYKRKCVYEVLINRLVKLAQEKKCG